MLRGVTNWQRRDTKKWGGGVANGEEAGAGDALAFSTLARGCYILSR